jgi:hypothetical protein
VSMGAVALVISGGGALSSLPSTKRWTPCARPSKSSTERLAHSGSRASDPLSRRLPGVRGDAEAAELAAGLIELAANTDTL